MNHYSVSFNKESMDNYHPNYFSSDPASFFFCKQSSKNLLYANCQVSIKTLQLLAGPFSTKTDIPPR